jgi:hypothetical protein
LASSSASLRSSAVRSGARLNINGLVYHRKKALGLTSLPGTATLLSAIFPGLVENCENVFLLVRAGSA